MMRLKRRKARTAELIQQNKEIDNRIVSAAIERSEGFDTTIKGKYSIWRKEYENPNSDSTLKLMRDQIIMAKAYTNIAKSMNKTGLYNALVNHSRDSQLAIGDARSDAELRTGYLFYRLCFVS
jgi:alpha-1,4-galacturonosyltransferase